MPAHAKCLVNSASLVTSCLSMSVPSTRERDLAIGPQQWQPTAYERSQSGREHVQRLKGLLHKDHNENINKH